MNVKIISLNPQFIYLGIVDCLRKRWNLAIVYASPTSHLHKHLWENLSTTALNISEHWMAIGDFNSVSCIDEVSSPEALSQRRCSAFNTWIFEQGLINLGCVGNKFTSM